MDKLQEYGKVGIITHLALSWTFFAATYLTINRTKNPQKIIKWLKLENKIPAKAGTLAISGIIYKAVMPIRIAVSLMAIPIVIKVFDIEIQKPEDRVQDSTQQTEKTTL